MKTLALALAAALCLPAAVSARAATPAGAHAASQTSTPAVPAGLRPVLYRALARDADPAYAINGNGCARLPQQKLRACFAAHSVRFAAPQTKPLALRLAAWGRGSALHPVTAVKPVIAGNRVRYTHGTLTEWWRVLPMGFEQGFAIARRPAGEGELTLALACGANSSVQDGTVAIGALRYGQLVVTDAGGKVVPSTLSTKQGEILIAVNDAGAAYPLSVDPLVWLEQKVAPGDSATYDYFGNSVAISGTTALVGAPGVTVGGNSDQGAAYVFTESAGTWTQTAKLTASDGAADDNFGNSVALDGSSALVGAPTATVGGNAEQGAAYVFTESAGTWAQTAKLTASDGAALDDFGWSVALSGTTALVGADDAAVGGNNLQGAAYVFDDSGGTWTQTQKLTANDGAVGDFFGTAVALAGTTALVGSPYADIGGNTNQGAVYVFDDSGGTWSQSAKLTAGDGAQGDAFGWSVALDGTTALFGAYGVTVGGNVAQGAAYVFDDSGGSWTQSAKLTASDGAADDQFGLAVALSGTTALAGAPQAGVNGNTWQGAAYVFTDSGGTWTQARKLVASDGAANDYFGYSVAVSGSTALVGALQATVGGNIEEGAAYFYGSADLDLLTTAPGTVAPYTNYLAQTIATNAGSATSPAVTLTVAVPAAASFVAATTTQGSCAEASNLVTCNVGPIGAGGSVFASVTLEATGTGGTTIDNTASVAHATPALTDSAPTAILYTCPDGYTEYDGTLGAGHHYRTPPYSAAAGTQTVVLDAPTDYRLYVGYRKTDTSNWIIRAPAGHVVYHNGPAGTYEWEVKAGAESGTYTLCIQHP